MQLKVELIPLPVSDVVRGAGFADPDGNSFELQEMAWRKGAKY